MFLASASKQAAHLWRMFINKWWSSYLEILVILHACCFAKNVSCTHKLCFQCLPQIIIAQVQIWRCRRSQFVSSHEEVIEKFPVQSVALSYCSSKSFAALWTEDLGLPLWAASWHKNFLWLVSIRVLVSSTFSLIWLNIF